MATETIIFILLAETPVYQIETRSRLGLGIRRLRYACQLFPNVKLIF